MAYRDDAGDVCEAPTAEGPLRAELLPRHLRLAVASRSLEISDLFVTAALHHRRRPARDRRASLRIAGRVIVARGVPREGIGIWVELAPEGRAGFRRVFGVEPVSLLEPDGLTALAALDRLAQRVRQDLDDRAPGVRRAVELGSPASGGLDMVLVIDHADHCAVYARRLFRDRARLVICAHDDGRIVLPEAAPGGRELTVRSRHGVTIVGDHVRFTDPHGTDLAKVAIPWITFEDRVELARRVGQRIDHEQAGPVAWPPRLTADSGTGEGSPGK
ncbi:MAG TPA: hypothetical protein VFT22_37830 [Kofleriaceae bacterium]|nr:hypothetical protein [Kofleriaceae bacterium]